MGDRATRLAPIIAILMCGVFACYLVLFRPSYLSDGFFLGGLIFLQILVVTIWHYRQLYFALLMVIFIWGGSFLPLWTIWTSGRWYVLIVGAVFGFVIYIKDRHHYFTAFHLVAAFCVVAAMVSGMVSTYPLQAALKATSLLLLFLYGASGARLAVMGRQQQFFSGLLLGCEILVYTCAVCYFILREEIFGNPNSLGAIMGVGVVPVLFWGILVAQGRTMRIRRSMALILGLFLLLSSYSRASIAGSLVSCSLLCIALRRYRLFLKGIGVAALASTLVVALVPMHESLSSLQITDNSGSVFDAYVYKGKPQEGVLNSRRAPWDGTVAVISERPWFGSGFGTSVASEEKTDEITNFETARQVAREHGNSYLAILEWVGLLGVLPFFTLAFLVLMNIGRVVAWMRRTGDPFSPAVPIAGSWLWACCTLCSKTGSLLSVTTCVCSFGLWPSFSWMWP